MKIKELIGLMNDHGTNPRIRVMRHRNEYSSLDLHLQNILDLHKKWLNGNPEGKRAHLSGTDLRGAELGGADLSHADFYGADLSHADLCGADLSHADLCGADLRGVNLDFSCLPLWCGSLTAHFDDRQLKQIAYHLVKAGLHSKNASNETKTELSKLVEFANQFHRASECGKIIYIKEENNENKEATKN